MTPEQFVYWLQGYIELNGNPPTPTQWASIKEHLSTVFDKRTYIVPRLNYDPSDLTPVTIC